MVLANLPATVGGPSQPNLQLRNDGTGRFTVASGQLPVDQDTTRSLLAFDVYLYGDVDLMYGNRGEWPEPNRLLRNDGRGRLVDAATSGLPSTSWYTWSLAAGDVDGDGDYDVLVGVYSLRPAVLLVNRHRQLETPWLAGEKRAFRVAVHAEPGYAPFPRAAFLGLQTRLSPAPISLPPFGSWRLDLHGLITLPPLTLPAPAGTAAFDVPLTRVPAGLPLYFQALLFDPSHPNGARFTGHTRDVILR